MRIESCYILLLILVLGACTVCSEEKTDIPITFDNPFLKEQMRYSRVRQAYNNVGKRLDSLYHEAGIESETKRVYIRAFKQEEELELWGAPDSNDTLRLIYTYDFTAFSGRLGPKWRQGDRQIPEGFYHIDRFNPASSYHLSLGINYPNRADRTRTDAVDPGGDIFIHGNAVTIGCIPIGDHKIKELYLACITAHANGQEKIPVHIFPCRMTDRKIQSFLSQDFLKFDPVKKLYEVLTRAYVAFEANHLIPAIRIDEKGQYTVETGQ